MEQEILDAQERLLKKREELQVTDSPTQLTTSFDYLKSLLPICQHGEKIGYCDKCNEERRTQTRPDYDTDEDEMGRKKQVEENKKKREKDPNGFMKRIVPVKFIDRSLDSFSGLEQIKKLCIEYSDGFIRKKICVRGRSIADDGLVGYPGSILFTGKTGCGKTHLAVAIVRELVNRSAVYDVKFITAPELLLEIRATFRPSAHKYDDGGRCEADTEQDILDKYSKCELLVLDDLGAEKVSDFTIQSLYLVIDRRNRDLRPTIVTTNLSLEEIETQIDARMASRLADMKVVKLTMPDYRKKR